MLLSNNKWSLYKTAPGEIDDAGGLLAIDPICVANTASTVARCLSEAGIPVTSTADDIDAYDWWYVCEFAAAEGSDYSRLCLDGLATLAEVWLNEQKVLTSTNMFVSHTVDVAPQIAATNTLAIAFRSVSECLKEKRPRPRWKTNLVDHQQLRWIRTTLLGRIPGWTPKARAIGPWRAIRLEQGAVQVDGCSVRAMCSGASGEVEVDVTVRSAPSVGDAFFEIDGKTYPLKITNKDGLSAISGSVTLDNVRLWNPHTHGEPTLYDYRVTVSVDGEIQTIRSGKAGFRSVRLVESHDKFAFEVNGREIFCRGACWTTADILSLTVDRDRLRTILQIVADSGANMIRIGGTMVYECDEFYELCDEMGILVWQDFMFANMDYPIDDEEFRLSVSDEIRQQVKRLAEYPCVTVFCGNSEVEQQAAMFGRPPEDYKNELFYTLIPEVLSNLYCNRPYIPASPVGGALPFHNSVGVSHYFGVGAYKRPISDAGTSGVLFASECLGFSNVPSDENMRRAFGSTSPVTHSPEWKAGIPRDTGPGWDFEDIRDYYFEVLTGEDAVATRYADNSGYLARSATVTGEVMRRAYAQWRAPENRCSGALIWNLMDIVPGAGWGFIDAFGSPKPVFYYLRRAWSPVCLSLIDKGLDGLVATIVNESADTLEGELNIQVLRQPRTQVASKTLNVSIGAGNHENYSLDEAIGYFLDMTYSYRFGPLGLDVIVVSLIFNDQVQVSDAYFPGSHALGSITDPELEITMTEAGGGHTIGLTSDCFLQDVALKAPGYEFSDNYFHLAPGVSKTVTATPATAETKRFRATLQAQNLESIIRLK